MNKKGFTLIELLAVIVILAIIALIAVPIVLNIIRDARESSEERSVELYAKAVKNAIMKKKIEEPKAIITGSYASTADGKNLTGSTTLNVEYDGEVYCKGIQVGSIVSSKNDYKLYLSGCMVSGSNNSYKYTDGTGAEKEGTVTATGSSKLEQPEIIVPESVDTVYFDVAEGSICTKTEYDRSWDGTDYSNSYTGYNGITKTNSSLPQNSCLKFYKYSEDTTTQTMILDHNTTAKVAWNSSGSNTSGPSTASSELLGKLKTDTKGWNGTITPSNYTWDSYTINYSGYKARIITIEEISCIIGDNCEIISTHTGIEATPWLYDRTSTDCTQYGCLNNSDAKIYGYWISSSIAFNSKYAWYVRYNGLVSSSSVYDYFVSDCSHCGVRPVITIAKS